MFCFGLYGYTELSDRQQSIEMRSSMCNCPGDMNCATAAINGQQLLQHSTSSHSYFEYMLEGLVRHAGLPLENARKALEKHHPGGLPLGWRWLGPWDDGVTAPTLAHPPKPVPKPSETGEGAK